MLKLAIRRNSAGGLVVLKEKMRISDPRDKDKDKWRSWEKVVRYASGKKRKRNGEEGTSQSWKREGE
jgi:hypothetical protein